MKRIFGITVIMSVLLFSSCGDDKKEVTETDTSAKVEARNNDGFKIAYYNQDSLQLNFKFYREQDSIVTKKQLAFQNEVQRQSADLQNYLIRNDERAKSGLLSENEIMQIQQTAQQKEAAIMNYQQTEGAKIEQETMNKLEVIGNKIEFFANKYCEENGIDILLIYARGGQINYIHPSMNVTKEFTEYLNQNQESIESDIVK